MCYKVCKKLGKRYDDKIVFGNFKEGKELLASIDCVHCQWEESRTDPGGKWFSHKSNGPQLSYEVCVNTVTELIVWTNGPFPAATHDITIFCGCTKKNGKHIWKKSSLFHKILQGKRLVGGSGYLGEPDKTSTTFAGHTAETKKLFAHFKSRQETLFYGYKALNINGGKPFHNKGQQGGGSQEQMAVYKLVFHAITLSCSTNWRWAGLCLMSNF